MADKITTTKRFWSQVKKTRKCWIWTGIRTHNGYGLVWGVLPKTTTAHRAAWELTFGPLPNGMKIVQVCHKCDNRLCVRPSHLFLGSPQDNTNDMIAKGRMRKAKGSAHGRAKLAESDVLVIRAIYASRILGTASTVKQKLIKKYGINKHHLNKILRRAGWQHI